MKKKFYQRLKKYRILIFHRIIIYPRAKLNRATKKKRANHIGIKRSVGIIVRAGKSITEFEL